METNCCKDAASLVAGSTAAVTVIWELGLRDFLRLRGLKLSGNKDELVARVFVAIENGVQIVKTAEEVQLEIANEYRAKLIIDDKEMPDTLLMPDGWISEENGIKYWPVTLYADIYFFLAFHPNELSSNDLSDYKTLKAYSYYTSGWLLPLLFHHINGDSKYCYILGTCKLKKDSSIVGLDYMISILKMQNGRPFT